MTKTTLLAPYSLGPLSLPNRMVMAPMTRYRAAVDGTPLPVVAEHYAQRAGAGLIVTEGIWPSSRGQSGWRLPGLETEAHVEGWRAVTEAVHAAAWADHGPADARRPATDTRCPGSTATCRAAPRRYWCPAPSTYATAGRPTRSRPVR